MAIKFTTKDQPKPDGGAARPVVPAPKEAVIPAEESELFPAAPKSPPKKR
jgi:hypothetical protein